MSGWWDQRSLLTRLLVYAVAAVLALVMAVSVGAVAALVVRGHLSLPAGERARPEKPSPAGEQGKIPQRQQEHTDKAQHGIADALGFGQRVSVIAQHARTGNDGQPVACQQ